MPDDTLAIDVKLNPETGRAAIALGSLEPIDIDVYEAADAMADIERQIAGTPAEQNLVARSRLVAEYVAETYQTRLTPYQADAFFQLAVLLVEALKKKQAASIASVVSSLGLTAASTPATGAGTTSNATPPESAPAETTSDSTAPTFTA